MASDYSKYMGNKLARWIAGNAFVAAPSTVYLALFNGDPKASGTEVTTTVRAAGRMAIDFEAAPAAGTDNDITTDGDSDFGLAAGAATVTHVAVYDAASSGNQLCSKALASSISVGAGEQVIAKAADLTFTFGS